MQKEYNFWFPEHQSLNSSENPYSGTRGTLNRAKEWAVQLFWLHKEVNTMKFKATGGRKEYTIHRGDFPCFFDHNVVHAPKYNVVTDSSGQFVVSCK